MSFTPGTITFSVYVRTLLLLLQYYSNYEALTPNYLNPGIVKMCTSNKGKASVTWRLHGYRG